MDGPPDLQELVGDFIAQVPDDPFDHVVFDRSNLPAVPSNLHTSSVLLQKRHTVYNQTWRVDLVEMHAQRATLRCLGLVILSVLFGDEEQVEVTMTHARAEIRTLRIQRPTREIHGLVSEPISWRYAYSPVPRFPGRELDDFPALYLTSDGPLNTDEDWKSRDLIECFGCRDGTLAMVKLLLDATNPANDTNEIALESDAGNGGVAPMSSELRIWLPGSFGWDL